MRPHRLVLTAFGPFPGEVEVDLDRLAAGGLFLLHGETGAGKTTLLDGLGFALFGQVPGPRREDRLRSDHADPAVRTVVQLEVTLGGRRWRITRSPAQQRPKLRGSGTTTEQARVLLERQGPAGWETVSTRLDEAAAELDPLLAMSAEQFFQVVLLPQGEFARFLRARNDERRQLLQRLFGTERFKDVEDRLAARRASTASAVGVARQALEVLQARLAQAAGVVDLVVEPAVESDRPARPDDEGAVDQGAGDLGTGDRARPGRPGDLGTAAPTWPGRRGGLDATESAGPGRLTELVAAQCEDARRTAQAAAARCDAARAAATAAERLAGRQARRREALAVLAALDAAQPDHERLGAELRAAAVAAELAPVLRDADDRATARAAATAAEAAQRARLPALGLAVDLTLPELRAAGDAARERSGRLDALRGVADDLAAERAAEARAGEEAGRAAAESARFEAALAALPERRRAAEGALATARAAAVRLPAARGEHRALVTARDDARRLAEVRLQVRDLREEHLSARETTVSLREKESELRDARLTSMVAELADSLVPGAPCEVCGSTTHPDPYEGGGEGVSREDEQRARDEADRSAARVADLAARLAAAAATQTDLQARLVAAGHLGSAPACAGEDAAGHLGSAPEGAGQDAAGLDARATARQLARRAEEAAQEVTALERLVAGEASAAAAVERTEAEQAAAEAGAGAARAARDAAARRRDEAAARADRHAGRLAADLAGEPDLDRALARAAALTGVCADVVAAAEQARRDAGEATRAAARAEAAAAAAGTTPDRARAQLRSPAWREEAARRRREHDDRRAAAEAALTDPELAVPLEPPADVAGTASALLVAETAQREAVGVLAAAQRRVEDVDRLVPAVVAAVEALAPLRDEADRVRRLADVCAGLGANALKMTLSSFVLAARLEEVAAAASVRLLRMTQGRYTLVHTDEAARGGARSGLGLLVRDAWTGRDRDTGTLSGGETFQASLALALGLADVVQAEAGGTRIEALFVDEGFGTLDEDTLDEVMDVLDGLREGGRVVGLVSHVAELRARIPSQVHVRKGRQGSTVALLGC